MCIRRVHVNAWRVRVHTAEIASPLSALQMTTAQAAESKPARGPLATIPSPSFIHAPSALNPTPHTYIWMFCQCIEALGRLLSRRSL